MRKPPRQWIVVLLAFLVMSNGEAAKTQDGSKSPPERPRLEKDFGSARILAGCWDTQALAVVPGEHKSRYKRESNPPSRQVPAHRLEPLPVGWRGSIRRVRLYDPKRKAIALTFDLCERSSETAGFDAELINLLRQHKARATLYAGGKWMRSHPERTQQLMADPLFEIGNHAWTHGNLRVLKGLEMQQQVLWTQAQYELVREELHKRLASCGLSTEEARREMARVPLVPLSFRYPYGTCSQETLDFMAEAGLPSIQWDIVTADPVRGQSAEAIAQVILKGAKPGSIIVAHANGRGWHTAEALRQVLPELVRRGFEFVTVSELLRLGEPEVATSCYENRPGDNAFYDRKVGKGTE